jgi:NAD(P)-dependent dehydrogenase (short-subunit alcohol dehydrogenase family)
MQAYGGGAIVKYLSLAALEPRLSYPLSTPIRTAALSFAKFFADRYSRAGIRMNNALPVFTENHEFPDAVRISIPMARTGYLAELAATVRSLFSAEAGYIAGQNIVVDGGFNRRI